MSDRSCPEEILEEETIGFAHSGPFAVAMDLRNRILSTT
jgi:hypothetical protein